MKKLILMLAIAGFITCSYAQNLMVSEVPAVVTKAFHKTHPKVDTIAWSKAGDFYKASYAVNKKDILVTYAATGKLQETETQLSVAELPTPVLKYINENYKNDVVKRAAKVISSKGKLTYAVKIKGTDLTFDSNGKFIK
jgi:hypothetical protein